MKFLVAVLLLGLVFAASAFDTNTFKKNYCVETKDSLVCTRFAFSAADKNDIQRTNFIISTVPKVEFVHANIGSLNENLINKFPNAVDFRITGDSNVYLNYTSSPISVTNVKLQKLVIDGGYVFNNNNSLALSKLTGLKHFELAPQHLEFPILDDVLLSKNIQLENVTIQLIESISNKAFINLSKLSKLSIEYGNIDKLPEDLLTRNTVLKELRLVSNRLPFIPSNSFFPKSLQIISLQNNNIQYLNNKQLVGLTNLKSLDLSINQISVISPDSFTNLSALESLNLSFNSINELTRKHFTPLKALKGLSLFENKFSKLPNDIFDDLTKIERVVIVDA